MDFTLHLVLKLSDGFTICHCGNWMAGWQQCPTCHSTSVQLNCIMLAQRHQNEGCTRKKVELGLYSNTRKDNVLAMAQDWDATTILKEQLFSARPNAPIDNGITQDGVPLQIDGGPIYAPSSGKDFQRIIPINLNPIDSGLKESTICLSVAEITSCFTLEETIFTKEKKSVPSKTYNISVKGKNSVGAHFNSYPNRKSWPSCLLTHSTATTQSDSSTRSNSLSSLYSDTTTSSLKSPHRRSSIFGSVTAGQNETPKTKALDTKEICVHAERDAKGYSTKPSKVNTGQSQATKNGNNSCPSSLTLVKTGRMMVDQSIASTDDQTEDVSAAGNYTKNAAATLGSQNLLFSQKHEKDSSDIKRKKPSNRKGVENEPIRLQEDRSHSVSTEIDADKYDTAKDDKSGAAVDSEKVQIQHIPEIKQSRFQNAGVLEENEATISKLLETKEGVVHAGSVVRHVTKPRRDDTDESQNTQSGSNFHPRSFTKVKIGKMTVDQSTASNVHNHQVKNHTTAANANPGGDAPELENFVFPQEHKTSNSQADSTKDPFTSELQQNDFHNTGLMESWCDISPASPTGDQTEFVLETTE